MGRYHGRISGVEAPSRGPWHRVRLDGGETVYMREEHVELLTSRFGSTTPDAELYFITNRFWDQVQWFGDEEQLRYMVSTGRIDRHGGLAPLSPLAEANAAALARGWAFVDQIAGMTADQWASGVLARVAGDALRRQPAIDAAGKTMEGLIKQSDPILLGLQKVDAAATDLIARLLPVTEASDSLVRGARRVLEEAARWAVIAVVFQERLDPRDVAVLLSPFVENASVAPI